MLSLVLSGGPRGTLGLRALRRWTASLSPTVHPAEGGPQGRGVLETLLPGADPCALLRKTLQLSRQLKDQAVEAQACYSLGNTYTLLQDYERAAEYHLRHLLIAQELADRCAGPRGRWGRARPGEFRPVLMG